MEPSSEDRILRIIGYFFFAFCSKFLTDAFVAQLIGEGFTYEKGKAMYYAVYLLTFFIITQIGPKASLKAIGLQLFAILCLLMTYLVYQILGDIYLLIKALFFANYLSRAAWSLICICIFILLDRYILRLKRDARGRQTRVHIEFLSCLWLCLLTYVAYTILYTAYLLINELFIAN